MNRSKLLTLNLLGVFILAACAPNVSAPEPAPITPQESVVAEVAELVVDTPANSEMPTEEKILGEPPARGNDLEATDPRMVNIANGELQLIEFFAFW